MLSIAKTSGELERIKLQQQIAEEQQKQRLARAAWAQLRTAMATQRDKNRKQGKQMVPKMPKKLKKDPTLMSEKDDDDDDEDLEKTDGMGQATKKSHCLHV